MLPITALENTVIDYRNKTPTILGGRMQPFAPYYPALVILAGATLVAIGGFWAAARQADFNARLNDKKMQ
jgi:hypothetical protein